MTDNDKKLHQLTEGVTRIANYMEEILKLVRADQERMKSYRDEENKSEQETRLGEYPGPPEPLAMAQGSRTKLQATSGKLQAASNA